MKATTTDWTAKGRTAHAAGLPRIPAADPVVAEAIEDLPVGAGAADIMRAWGQGWDTANLAADACTVYRLAAKAERAGQYRQASQYRDTADGKVREARRRREYIARTFPKGA